VFGIFFTPVFYVVIRWLTGLGKAVPGRVAGPDAGKALATDGAASHDALAHKPGVVTPAQSETPAHRV